MLTWLVNGGRRERLGDGVDAPTKPASLTKFRTNVRSINGETIAIDGRSLTRGLCGTADRAEESMTESVDEVLSGSDRPVSQSGTSPRGGPLAGEPHR